MKELDIFFEKISEVIDETYKLNNSPKYSYFGKFSKMFYKDYIIVVKWIIKFSLEMKYAESENQRLSKQRSLNSLLYTYKYTIGDKCKSILIRYLFSSSCSLGTKICKEAMKELKVISSNLFSSSSITCPELLQKELFSIPNADRFAYAKLIAKELDGRVSATYLNIKDLEEKGWDSTYLKRDISTFLLNVFEKFALFNIDLTPIIKQNSDFEKKFGTYEYFRDEQFNRTNYIEDANLQYNNTDNDTQNIIKESEGLTDNKIWVLGDSTKKKKTLEILHTLIGKGKAAHASKILKAAIKAGAIVKPTYTQIKKEFPSIGNESGYNNQMQKNHNIEEITPLITSFIDI